MRSSGDRHRPTTAVEEVAVDKWHGFLVEGTKLLRIETKRRDLLYSHVHERYREHVLHLSRVRGHDFIAFSIGFENHGAIKALRLAEDAARELPNLPLEDALQRVHLYIER